MVQLCYHPIVFSCYEGMTTGGATKEHNNNKNYCSQGKTIMQAAKCKRKATCVLPQCNKDIACISSDDEKKILPIFSLYRDLLFIYNVSSVVLQGPLGMWKPKPCEHMTQLCWPPIVLSR